MNNNILSLDNQICFPLYACSKEIIKKYKPYLDKLNLTYTQYITMLVLWENNEINVKALGEKIYLDSGTLTPLLKKLESKGYIVRLKNNKDGRNLVIRITNKGIELRDRAKSIPESIGKCINISKKDAFNLYQILHRILGEINE